MHFVYKQSPQKTRFSSLLRSSNAFILERAEVVIKLFLLHVSFGFLRLILNYFTLAVNEALKHGCNITIRRSRKCHLAKPIAT